MMTQQEQLVDNGKKDADLSPYISTSPVSNNNRGSKLQKNRESFLGKIVLLHSFCIGGCVGQFSCDKSV